MAWYVYILRCADGSLYTGSTTDVARRFAQHQSGRGAKYTRSHPPLEVAYWEATPDKGAAFSREAAIKGLTHRQKERLIQMKEEQPMHQMRRKDREITTEEAWQIVERSDHGVIAMTTAEGPYAVPVNLVRAGDALYFHSALEGRKIDALMQNPEVCVSFVAHEEIVGEKLTTRYDSAIVFGTAAQLTDETERWEALRLLCERFAPDHMDAFESSRSALPRTAVWKITAKTVTGKANRK